MNPQQTVQTNSLRASTGIPYAVVIYLPAYYSKYTDIKILKKKKHNHECVGTKNSLRFFFVTAYTYGDVYY